MEKIKFNKGESISIGFLLNSEYDMNRIESCSAWVGGKKFPLATIGQMLRCEIKSTETHLLAGKYKLILWIDDSVLGIKKIEVADVEISFNHANDNNSSINEGYDFVFNITINETAIEAGDVLYNYVKGDSADLPDGIVIDSEYWDDKERLENTSGTNTGDQDLTPYQTITDHTLQTAATTIAAAINEVRTIALGSDIAYVFDTEIAMDAWLAIPENVALLKTGNILLIREVSVPDYWWDGTQALELEVKIDLTNYYTKLEIDQLLGNKSDVGHNHSGEGINPDYIVLDEEYTDLTMVALPVGSLFYNVDQLSWLLKTSTTTYLNLGEENTYIAKNGDGITHLEGQATYVTSGGGNLDVMTLASSANGKVDALATHDVSHTGNWRGMYCFGGKVRTFPYSNVIKSTDNENTWIEGAELYLCSEPGRYSTTKEAAPAKCSVVGKITQRNGANISVSFRPFKAIAFEDLSNVDGNATTLADTDEHLFKDVVTGLIKKITHSNLVTKLATKFGQLATTNTWALLQTFTSGLKTTKIIPNSDTTGVVIRNAADTSDFAYFDFVNNLLNIGGIKLIRSNVSIDALNNIFMYGSVFGQNGTKYVAGDVALSRSSAGVYEINNGTVGILRDLKLRSLYADKIMLNALNTAPSSPTDTGTAGEIRIDANYIYFCFATNQWKRTPLSTW